MLPFCSREFAHAMTVGANPRLAPRIPRAGSTVIRLGSHSSTHRRLSCALASGVFRDVAAWVAAYESENNGKYKIFVPKAPDFCTRRGM